MATNRHGAAGAARNLWAWAALALFLPLERVTPDEPPAWVAMRRGTTGSVVWPAAASLGPENRLYVTSTVVGRVEAAIETVCLAPDGSTLWTAVHEPAGMVAHSYAIAVRGDGHSYVTGSVHPGVRNQAFVDVEFVVLSYDPDGQLLWAERPRVGGAGRYAAVMPDGGVVVSGRCDPGAPCAHNIVTLRYDSSGQLIWRREWDGPLGLDDEPEGLAVDAEGNIYIAGIADQDYWTCDDDEEDCPAAVLTLSYSPTGQLRWEKFAGVGYSSGTALARTGTGRVYVAGFVEPEPRQFEYFVACYDERDGHTVWTQRFRPAHRDDRPRSLLATATGEVFVAGEMLVALDPAGEKRWDIALPFRAVGALQERPGGGVVTVGRIVDEGAGAEEDIAVVAVDAAAGMVWERRYDGPVGGEDHPVAVLVSDAGDVRVVGSSDGEASVHERLVVAYDAAGDELWVDRALSSITGRETAAERVVIGPDGGIYIAGTLASDRAVLKYSAAGDELWIDRPPPTRFPQWRTGGLALIEGSVFVTGGDVSDMQTLALDSSGTALWSRRIDRGRVDQGRALAAKEAGPLYVAGYSQRPGHPWDAQLVVIAYDHDGTERWFAEAEGSSSDFANDMVMNPAGGVYAVGTGGPRVNTGILTVSLDAEGDVGWQRFFEGPRRESGLRVRTNDTGAVWVLGESRGGSRGQIILLHYAANGDERWNVGLEERAGAPDIARGLVVDERGQAIVGVTRQSAAGDADVLIASFDAGGSSVRQHQIDGVASGDDDLTAMRIGPSGTLWLAMSSASAESGADFVLVELDSATFDELRAWRWTSDGVVDDRPHDFAFDAAGNVVVVGSSGHLFTTVKFRTAAGNGPQFVRGNCDGSPDGKITIADPIFLLNYRFAGGAEPSCHAACDTNGDGDLGASIANAVYLLNHLFAGGPAPPAPYPECGTDPAWMECVQGACAED